MAETEPTSPGILASVRRMADTALSTLHNRIELFALELQEEKFRLITLLLWVAAAIFFCVLAISFVAVAIVYFSPEKARPYVLGAFCLIFIGLAVSAVAGLRKELLERPSPLSDTLSELKKDIHWLRSQE